MWGARLRLRKRYESVVRSHSVSDARSSVYISTDPSQSVIARCICCTCWGQCTHALQLSSHATALTCVPLPPAPLALVFPSPPPASVLCAEGHSGWWMEEKAPCIQSNDNWSAAPIGICSVWCASNREFGRASGGDARARGEVLSREARRNGGGAARGGKAGSQW